MRSTEKEGRLPETLGRTKAYDSNETVESSRELTAIGQFFLDMTEEELFTPEIVASIDRVDNFSLF